MILSKNGRVINFYDSEADEYNLEDYEDFDIVQMRYFLREFDTPDTVKDMFDDNELEVYFKSFDRDKKERYRCAGMELYLNKHLPYVKYKITF
jgi:hypothetical protein